METREGREDKTSVDRPQMTFQTTLNLTWETLKALLQRFCYEKHTKNGLIFMLPFSFFSILIGIF